MRPLGVGDAGVVDQDVDGSEDVARPGHDVADLGGVGDVEGHRLADPAAGADRAGQLLQPVHPPCRGHDRRAGAGQRGGEAVAEPGAGPGDQGDSAGEIGWFEHVAGVAPTGIGGATEGSPPDVHPFSKPSPAAAVLSRTASLREV